MKEEVKNAIEEYQCSGCVSGPGVDCFEDSDTLSCKKHCAGTILSGIGKIFLGLPKGFHRLGPDNKMPIWIYEDVKDFEYSKFNIAVWKHKTKKGHIFVRGLMPRINQSFLQIFLAGDFDSIKALEITEKDIKEMD